MTIGIDVLDTGVQETSEWLVEIEGHLKTRNRKLAYNALKATLHAIRDRIGPDHAPQLAEQLPVLIKGIFWDGFRSPATPVRDRTLAAFLQRVDNEVFRGLGVDPQRAVRVVLEVMAEHLDPVELQKVERLIPQELRELWPSIA